MNIEPSGKSEPKTKFLTMAAGAREAGLSRSTIDRAYARGEFKATKYGRLRLIHRDEFERWISKICENAA